MPWSLKKRQAFTIGEVVLASFVLTLGLTSVVALISASFRSSIENQNVIIAAELAQEGIELVRNVRDNDLLKKVLTGSPDDVFVNFPNGNGSRCTINYDDVALSCGGNPDRRIDVSSGFYQTPSGAGATKFYRLIKIDYVPPATTARVKSFATWQDPGTNLNSGSDTNWCTLANKCVYTEIFLTEWQ